jgi:hypothetical protein
MQSSRDSPAPPETDTTTTTAGGSSATDAGKKLGRGRRVREHYTTPAKELHCTALHKPLQDFVSTAGIAFHHRAGL